MALLFFGALFWAQARDPFERIWFKVKAPGQAKARGVAVLPKNAARPYPLVIYSHGAGGDLIRSGNELRQMAEMGLAAVGLEYNQTNELAFEAQFAALLRQLHRQKWVDTNRMAWVGFSLGAQRQLSFALRHPELQPRLLVRVAGGWVAELDNLEPRTSNIEPRTPKGQTPATRSAQLPTVLLLHGEQDGVFPVAEAERVAAVLRATGFPVELQVLRGQSHGLEPDRGIIFRATGEYCLRHLRGPAGLRNYQSMALWQSKAWPLWVYWIPAWVWIGAWVYGRRRAKASRLAARQAERAGGTGETPALRARRRLTRLERALRWGAAILAVLALAQTALHLITPRLAVSGTPLKLARKFLVQPQERADFDYLAPHPVWRGQRLRTLLTHVELANYNRGLVNWTLEEEMYREFVLSPVITGAPGEGLKWRRPLWESFYPRIRKVHSVEAAAEMVVRHLRERVTMAGGEGFPNGVEGIWLRQITNERGFEVICVAALRSAGVPARLNADGRAEFRTESEWKLAPRPVVGGFGSGI